MVVLVYVFLQQLVSAVHLIHAEAPDQCAGSGMSVDDELSCAPVQPDPEEDDAIPRGLEENPLFDPVETPEDIPTDVPDLPDPDSII